MIAQELIDWYKAHKRSLPWRETNDPYYIWLSEIILQQTRVEQGKPYYFKFLESFPTIEALASAKEEEVLRLWQGLGYYSRARNLHFTAKFIQNELQGEFPKTYKELVKLKGVGPYTAAAIASFAFGEAKAVVDGNVYRVLSRVFNISEAINSPKGIREFQNLADELIDPTYPGLYNQGIMELGALVCKPVTPLCNQCPIRLHCQANKNKNIEQRPVKLKKVKVRSRFFQYLVFRFEEKWLLGQRGGGDIWQGMYDFPMIETNNENGEEDVLTFLKSKKLKTISLKLVENKKHILTHQVIKANFWEIELSQLFQHENARFFSKVEIELLPKPKLIVNYIQKNLNL